MLLKYHCSIFCLSSDDEVANMLDLSIGFTALRCNLETILGEILIVFFLHLVNNHHNALPCHYSQIKPGDNLG